MQTYPTKLAAYNAAFEAGVTERLANIYPVVKGSKIEYAFEKLTKRTFVRAADPAPEAPAPDVAPRTYKRPQKGVCADVWNWCDANQPTSAAQVREHGASVGWNPNNCTTEYYGWRRAGMH